MATGSQGEVQRVGGPEQLWAEYPDFRDSTLFGEYLNRLAVGRDMHVVITAASETGVGKTTLAVSLALLWDQWGWTADKASVASAPKYSHLYDQVRPGSVLILDEAEKAADNRRGMTKSSVALSQAFAAKRYRQVFGMLTAPAKSWIDDRIGSDAADYWIQAQETDRGRVKGEAKVYRLKTHEHYESEYTKKTEYITWPILDGHQEYERLDQMKQERLEGNAKSEYVHRDDVEEMEKEAWDEAEKQTEKRIMERLHELSDPDLNQKQIAKVFGVHQTTISRRLDGE